MLNTETRYCDLDDCICWYFIIDDCNVVETSNFNSRKEKKMNELEKKMQMEEFDVEVQYCDPDDCLRDCMHSGVNNCDAIVTGYN